MRSIVPTLESITCVSSFKVSWMGAMATPPNQTAGGGGSITHIQIGPTNFQIRTTGGGSK